MRWIAAFACQCLYRLRVWQMLLTIENAIGWRRQLVVLLYHHIRADGDDSLPLSHVEEGVKLSTFENQICEFRQWYQPITSLQADSAISGNIRMTKDAMLVTFDDGYQDNRTLAGPVLRKHQVPALLFLATGFVETTERFWWVWLNDVIRDLSSDSLKRAEKQLVQWPEVAELLAGASVTNHQGCRQIRVSLATILESKTDQEKNDILESLQSVVDGRSTTCLPILDWTEIYKMRGEGFELGAHTVTHPRLTQLPAGQVRQEMATSAQAIDEHTGYHPAAFAYPYGDYNNHVEQAARQAGFSIACAANPGVATPGRTSPTCVPRMQLHASESANLLVIIFIVKLGKYLPRLARIILSHYFGESFEI